MRLSAVAAVAAVSVVSLCAFPAKTAHAQAGGFPDVPSNHWAAASVEKLVGMGILAAPPKQAAKPGPKYNGDKAVTRYELAVTLDRFVQYLERADKQKKSKYNVQATPAEGAAATKRLIAGGYLPATTALATDATKVVTAKQLADAMTRVIVKVREKKVPISPDSELAPIQPLPGAGR